ncbi:MAG: CARDB domain-containing protein, partial [Bacteroidota bacterium]
MAATAITEPAGDACFGTNESIVVEVENQGTQTIDFATDNMTVTVEVTGPNANTYSTTIASGTLASLGTQLVTVTTGADLSVGGQNDLTAYIAIANDPNGINDTVATSVQTIPIVTIPYSEDFETFTVGNPGVLDNGWSRTSAAPGRFPWVPNTGVTTSGGTGPDGDHTTNFGPGVYMYTEASFPAVAGDTATLSSPCIDLAGQTSATLEFWYHMFGGDMGTLELDIIRIGGDTTNVFSVSGQQQTAGNEDWLNVQVDMAPFLGDTVILQWVGVMGPSFGSDMAIDDIRFVFADDIKVASLEGLNNGRQLTSTQLGAANTVTANITNVGTTDAFNFPASLWLDGTVVATEMIMDTISPGDTLSFTFVSTLDFTLPGDYDVRVYTSYGVDSDNSNDTAQQIVKHVENAPLQLPYSEGFESVTVDPLTGGTFAITGIDRFDHESVGPSGRVQFDLGFQRTGIKSAYLDASANGVVPDAINYLIATFNMANFTAADSIYLDFYLANNGDEPDPNDRVWIRGSENDPWIQFVDWTTVPSTNTFAGFTDINVTKLLTDNGQAYSTSTQIRWGQEDNFTFTGPDGLSIDDIGLRKIFNFDAAATNVLAPLSGECGSDSTFFTIDITNEGFVPLTTVPVTTEITFPDQTVQTFQNTLTPANLALLFGESESIQVGPVNTTSGGTFKVTSFTTLTTDELTVNDTVMGEVELKSALPPMVMLNEPLCEGDSAILSVIPEDNISYVLYDSPTGGTGLDTGLVFNLGPVTTPNTFYVGDISFDQKVGAVDSAIGTGGYYSFFTDGLLFDAQQDFTIQDVRLYPDTLAGDIVVNLLSGTTTIFSDTFAFGGTVSDTVVTLNWPISPGSYSINLDGTTAPALWRNNGSAVYPYSIPGVIDITGPINGLAGFYYFFYDWTITFPLCPRDRREVVVAPGAIAS